MSTTPSPALPRRRALAMLAAIAALPVRAQSGAYPQRPVRLVVPFPPGGSTDLLARRIAERLAKTWGQPVVVENRAGAGGTTGADFVAKSAPDGHTLLMGVTGSNAIAASLFPKLPYDPIKDFTPVTQVVSAPLVLSVTPGAGMRGVRDYVAAARARPITHASPGNGTSMHLVGEMFALATGVKLTHVPYKGSAPAMNDLLAGTVNSMFGDVLVLLPQIRAGKVLPLAVSSARRHPLLPEVPTFAEAGTGADAIAGLAGFEAASWQGLFAPAGTAPDVVAAISAEVGRILETPELREFFGGQGFIVGGSTPAEFRALVGAEVPKWGRVVRAANVVAE
ncbi:MAG: tripartite tricarboxylate transporter substrate binding protein [Burkholderiales bacterium]|nr:tripartite tricarboxylate transporter substrate binding protein [Burkholderiales bacterium]